MRFDPDMISEIYQDVALVVADTNQLIELRIYVAIISQGKKK